MWWYLITGIIVTALIMTAPDEKKIEASEQLVTFVISVFIWPVLFLHVLQGRVKNDESDNSRKQEH